MPVETRYRPPTRMLTLCLDVGKLRLFPRLCRRPAAAEWIWNAELVSFDTLFGSDLSRFSVTAGCRVGRRTDGHVGVEVWMLVRVASFILHDVLFWTKSNLQHIL